jgi:hypothetical protein
MAKKGDKLVGSTSVNNEKDFQKKAVKALTGINNNIANLNDTIAELNATVEVLKNTVVFIASKK